MFVLFVKNCQNIDLTEEYLKTVLIRIHKWSDDRKCRYSQAISRFPKIGIKRMGISRICPNVLIPSKENNEIYEI